MSDTITTYYASNPWEAVTATERDYYEPALLRKWKRKSYYQNYIPFLVDMESNHAYDKMIFSGVYDAPVDKTPLGLHDLWKERMQINSYRIEIQTYQYGGVIAVHKNDIPKSYWSDGLVTIAKGQLGDNMIWTLDELMRDAFLDNAPFTWYAGSQTGVADLTTSDTFDKDKAGDIWVGLAERGIEIAADPGNNWNGVIALVSDRQLYDIRRAAGNAWTDTFKYARPDLVLNWEIGTYEGVRFVRVPVNRLMCRGQQINQTQLSAAASSGSGASETVDATYKPQLKTDCVRYIDVDSSSGFSVGDWVIITPSTVSTPLFSTPRVEIRRIVTVDPGSRANSLALDRPLDWDWAVDSYVTKAHHAHCAVFLGGTQGVVGAVYRRPTLHAPQPIDDFESMQRFSWDAWIGFQKFMPDQYQVYWTGGSAGENGTQ